MTTMKTVFAVGMSVTFTFASWAYTETVDGIEWEYTVENGEATIGDDWHWWWPSSPPSGAVVIPATLGGYPVTHIGEMAFDGCEEMTSVVIPDSVKRIGRQAFSSCTGLVSVTIGAGVTSIGDVAFSHCSGLTTVTMPDSVQHIGSRAFGFCYALTSVTIPGSVTSIGVAPFCGCRNLMSIEVAESNPAYASANGLLLTKDGKTLVQGVNRDVPLPDSVTSIGDWAFLFCDALTNLTISAGVTSIGDAAFVGCGGLSEFVVAEGNSSYKSESGLLLTKDGKTLVAALAGADNVAIPVGVTSIGIMAFCYCTNLVSVTIPAGVTNIGDSAFEECYNLKSVTIPIGVTDIGEMAFYLCKNLEGVTIPGSVTRIGGYSFTACHSLMSIFFEGNAPKVGDRAFSYVNDACAAYVPVNSTGWDVDIPGTWHGLRIEYADGEIVHSDGDAGQIDVTFSSAQSLIGELRCADTGFIGTIQLKVGKMGRKGTAKVSATAFFVSNGAVKKVNAKSTSLYVISNGPKAATLSFKAPIGDMVFAMNADGRFSIANDRYRMVEAKVGGNLPKGAVEFSAAIDQLPDFGDGMSVVEDVLPFCRTAKVSNGRKLDFGKAATVRYRKHRDGGVVRYELDGLGDAAKPNGSSLKVTYTPKTGFFKGSFKVYATNSGGVSDGIRPKLKKISVNVAGVFVDGKGVGQAAMKNPLAKWPVSIVPVVP